tara:strand:+ start:14 stop:631 length:618 start_codon:yes stop_codon:yes gene_type:complete
MSGIVTQNLNKQSGLIKAPEGGGAWTFIKKLTASSSGDLSFVDGTSDVVLDGTYAEYIFYFVNIHPGTADKNFTFNVSIDSGSNYNVAKTTTYFRSVHDEADSYTNLGYDTGRDLAQGTGFQPLSSGVDAAADGSVSGYLHLFEPSSTTFVKHYISVVNAMVTTAYSMNDYSAGYANTTSAVDAVQFKFASGEIQGGSISMYGIG